MYAILSKGVAMKSVMELLYELRVDHDLTQAEVGAVLGISQQHYSKYETGEYELPLRHFRVRRGRYHGDRQGAREQSGAERGRHGLPDRAIQLRKSAP